MGKLMSIPFDFSEASFYDIKEVNSSFAVGTLKVMYLGKNRNGSHFTKNSVEKALPSLHNVPIVCHWNDEEREIGGHDMAVVADSEGGLRLKTLTEPCGVVPDHAKFSFAIERDGSDEHEYLIIENVILWKRQDVYSYIVNDLNGVVKHSMEINVNESHKMPDGYIDVTDFEFTALCLLGNCEPCFEGSQLELFSAQTFKKKMEEMMSELKEVYTLINPSYEVDNTHPQNSTEGGETVLDNEKEMATVAEFETEEEKRKRIAKADDDDDVTPTPSVVENTSGGSNSGLTSGTTTGGGSNSGSDNASGGNDNANGGDTTGTTTEQPQQTENTQTEGETQTTEQTENTQTEGTQTEGEQTDGTQQTEGDNTGDGDPDTTGGTDGYALTQGVVSEIERGLEGETVETCWGEMCRYIYVDSDFEAGMVYCFDINDWLLYGFKYTMNGDAVDIDYDSKKRYKFSIVEFDEGEQADKLGEFYAKATKETEVYKQFKADVEAQEAKAAREEILSKFTDLANNEEFTALVEKSAEFDCDTLLEKCYAIRGKCSTVEKVTFSNKAPKLCVETKETEEEPYGGLFTKYGLQ